MIIIISGTPQALWDRTHNESGISEDFFMQYFSDRETGYAIQIKEYREYEKPIQPEDVFGYFVVPQSYRYVADEEWKELQLVL